MPLYMHLQQFSSKWLFALGIPHARMTPTMMLIDSVWHNAGVGPLDMLVGGAKTQTIEVNGTTYVLQYDRSKLTSQHDANGPIREDIEQAPGSKYEYIFLHTDCKTKCGHMVLNFDTKVAYIGLLHNYNGCVLKETDHQMRKVTNNVGSIMLVLMIEFCKYRAMKQIKLDDKSYFTCAMDSQASYFFELKHAHVLTHGESWYAKFGFAFDDLETQRIAAYNKQKYDKICTKHIDVYHMLKQLARVIATWDIPVDAKKTVAAIKSAHDRYKDEKAGVFFRYIQREHCALFARCVIEFVNSLGYKILKGTSMTLNLS